MLTNTIICVSKFANSSKVLNQFRMISIFWLKLASWHKMKLEQRRARTNSFLSAALTIIHRGANPSASRHSPSLPTRYSKKNKKTKMMRMMRAHSSFCQPPAVHLFTFSLICMQSFSFLISISFILLLSVLFLSLISACFLLMLGSEPILKSSFAFRERNETASGNRGSNSKMQLLLCSHASSTLWFMPFLCLSDRWTWHPCWFSLTGSSCISCIRMWKGQRVHAVGLFSIFSPHVWNVTVPSFFITSRSSFQCQQIWNTQHLVVCQLPLPSLNRLLFSIVLLVWFLLLCVRLKQVGRTRWRDKSSFVSEQKQDEEGAERRNGKPLILFSVSISSCLFSVSPLPFVPFLSYRNAGSKAMKLDRRESNTSRERGPQKKMLPPQTRGVNSFQTRATDDQSGKSLTGERVYQVT